METSDTSLAGSGCSAASCSANAEAMVADEDGYIEISTAQAIRCGLIEARPQTLEEEMDKKRKRKEWCEANPEKVKQLSPMRTWLRRDSPLWKDLDGEQCAWPPPDLKSIQNLRSPTALGRGECGTLYYTVHNGELLQPP